MRLTVRQAQSGQLPYPTNPYPVKKEEQIGNLVPPVSPAGAAAVEQRQNEGITSSPNAFERPQQASPQH